MCITEEKLVDCYETGLFNRILFEVEYNRQKKNDDDLGVRVQTSHRSDPTAAKAIEHIMIRDAIEECNFSGNILMKSLTQLSRLFRRRSMTSYLPLSIRNASCWRLRRTETWLIRQ